MMRVTFSVLNQGPQQQTKAISTSTELLGKACGDLWDLGKVDWTDRKRNRDGETDYTIGESRGNEWLRMNRTQEKEETFGDGRVPCGGVIRRKC